MNETGHNSGHFCPRRGERAGVPWGAVAAVLIAASLWAFMGGCADPRSKPLAPASPGYTETITLWNGAVSDSEKISAPFTVGQPLAPIRQLGVDHPARLTLVAFITPDADILRRETVTGDSLPKLTDSLTLYQATVFAREFSLDSALLVDSLCRMHPDSCSPEDTLGLAALIEHLQADLIVWTDKWTAAMADTIRLGLERDSLGHLLDDRYRLAIWMDDDTTARYPQAAFDSTGFLGGQAIYAAATGDSTTALPGMKGRGFALNLDKFSAADPVNPTRSLEVNWTQCFTGLSLPCLSVGPHTLHVLVTGPGSRVTGTLVLVYEEVTP
ncbi:MAG: hypothetical protein NT025_07160 [bacterium]|nr:hypothetical protein [bacterium]